LREKPLARVAVVDYGLGNLFSVARACEAAGLEPIVTPRAADFRTVDGIILPGVGAFGSAMEALAKCDLLYPLLDEAAAGTPIAGVCLGMQLLMSDSEEFGSHRGLGLIEGHVRRFPRDADRSSPKVPQIGWNRIRPAAGAGPKGWAGSPLSGLRDGEFMYFVHSYFPMPADAGVVLSTSVYGETAFCSALARGNIFGFQFHPERSGRQGLRIYDNFARIVRDRHAVASTDRA